MSGATRPATSRGVASSFAIAASAVLRAWSTAAGVNGGVLIVEPRSANAPAMLSRTTEMPITDASSPTFPVKAAPNAAPRSAACFTSRLVMMLPTPSFPSGSAALPPRMTRFA